MPSCESRVRRALTLALCLVPLAAASAAFADDPPKRPGMGDGFRFSPPEGEGATGQAPAGKQPKVEDPAANDPVAKAIRALATWPGRDGTKAAESLLLTGKSVTPALEAALNGSDPAVKPGVAWVLGKLGDPVDVQYILAAAANRANGSRLEVFFEAAQELDPVATKKWLFSFLSVLDRPMFRARATEFLAGIVGPEDREKTEALIRSSRAPIKITGLELLARSKGTDVAERLIEALSEPVPEVAKRATQLLAGTDQEALLPRLNSIAREGDSRARAYATLTLVEFARHLRRNTFEAATVTELVGRRGLSHPDKLSRGAAAAGLAWGALDTADPTVGALLDGTVVDVLIDTVAGDHFRDYESLVEPTFAALRRLSGLDLNPSAQAWGAWWLENRGKFRARRLLSAVPDEDVPRSRVVFDAVDAEGRRRRVAFVPKGPVAPRGFPGAEKAYVLPVPVFKALLVAVEEAGVFRQADDGRTLGEEHLAVRLGVLNQERRLVLQPREDGRYADMVARLTALEDSNVWQRYRDTDEFPDPVAWWDRQGQVFEGADASTRAALLTHAVVFSFDDLPADADRMEALDLLERQPVPLTDAEATHLLHQAATSVAFGAVETRVVRMVAAMERSGLADALVEALAGSKAPAATALLASALEQAGPMRVREGFADPRLAVRSASAAAAAGLLSGPLAKDPMAKKRVAEVLRGGLSALLADSDAVVRARAATGLALAGEPDMIRKLEELYRDGDPTAKIAVAEALGRIGGAEVHPLLIRIVGEVGEAAGPIRSAALEAIGRTNHPNAVKLLTFYLLNDTEAGVRDSAATALVRLGGDDAQFALVDALLTGNLDPSRRARAVKTLGSFDTSTAREALGRHLEDPDASVVDEAALALARQGEGVSVPYLVAILRRAGDATRGRALETLEEVTSLTPTVSGFEAAAEEFERWYALNRQGGDRAWFRDAVKRKGYDAAALGGYVHGDADLHAVPLLLKTIRDDDPILRANSDRALRRISGKSFGTLERTTPREEAKAIADRWSTWWARRPAAAAGAPGQNDK
jgi:HEAT repeat protein